MTRPGEEEACLTAKHCIFGGKTCLSLFALPCCLLPLRFRPQTPPPSSWHAPQPALIQAACLQAPGSSTGPGAGRLPSQPFHVMATVGEQAGSGRTWFAGDRRTSGQDRLEWKVGTERQREREKHGHAFPTPCLPSLTKACQFFCALLCCH